MHDLYCQMADIGCFNGVNLEFQLTGKYDENRANGDICKQAIDGRLDLSTGL